MILLVNGSVLAHIRVRDISQSPSNSSKIFNFVNDLVHYIVLQYISYYILPLYQCCMMTVFSITFFSLLLILTIIVPLAVFFYVQIYVYIKL